MDMLPNKNGLALDVSQLMVRCECMDKRELISSLWPKLASLRITAVVSHFNGNDWRQIDGQLYDEPKIDCEFCRNTGFRLSSQGKELAEFLERYATDFLDEVLSRRKKEETEDETETD